MKTNILTLVITLVVGVILTGALLGPVIDDTTATTATFTNEGYLRMSSISATDETSYNVTWDVSTPNVINVNGETVNIDTTNAPGEISVLFDEDWVLRANLTNGSITSITYIPNNGIGFNATNTLSCTLNQGTMSVTDGSTTKTEDYSIVYVPDNEGAFIMKTSDGTAYIHEDSELIGFGLSTVRYGTGTGQRGITYNGSIANGVEPTIWRPPADTTGTISNVQINATEITEYIDAYKLTNITMDFHYSGETGEADTTLTYSYFLVPAEITCELSQHLNDGEISLMKAIPIMVIVALLMLAVGAIALRRAD